MGRMCIVSLRVFGLWRRAAELMRGSSSWPPSKPSSHERRAAFFYLPSPSSSSSSSSSHRSQETDFQCFPTTAVQHCVFLPALGMAAVVWCVCVCVWGKPGTLKVMIRCVKWNSASRSSWMITFSTPAADRKQEIHISSFSQTDFFTRINMRLTLLRS